MDHNKPAFTITTCVLLYLLYLIHDKCNLYSCGSRFFFLLIHIELKMFMTNDYDFLIVL